MNNKMSKSYFNLLIIIILVCSCRRNDTQEIISPSGNYKLIVEVNQSKADPARYACVKFTLHNGKNELLSTYQTGASDAMKWAVDWYPGKDTIILYSSDIGESLSWGIDSNNSFKEIQSTKDIDSLSKIIFQKKYNKLPPI